MNPLNRRAFLKTSAVLAGLAGCGPQTRPGAAPLLAYVGTFSSPLRDMLPTQVDLPPGRVSGLVEAERILKGIPGIFFQYFSEEDVVRHPLVSEIVKAYEGSRHEKKA